MKIQNKTWVRPEGYQNRFTFDVLDSKVSIYFKGKYIFDIEYTINNSLYERIDVGYLQTSTGCNFFECKNISREIFSHLINKFPELLFKENAKNYPQRNSRILSNSEKIESMFVRKILESIKSKYPYAVDLYNLWRRTTPPKYKEKVGSNLLLILPQLNEHLVSDLFKYKFLRELIIQSNTVKSWCNWREDILKNVTNKKVVNQTIDNWRWSGKSVLKFIESKYVKFLNRPINNRTKLYLIIYSSQNKLTSIFEQTDIKTIKKSANLLKQNNNNFKLTSLSGCFWYLGLLSDYVRNENYQGADLINLTKRSIEWHERFAHENNARISQRYLQNHDPNTKTAAPPFEIDIEGVSRLETLQSIMDESAKMKHCVASYANMALDGSCFLYHVDFEGEMATVEVSCRNTYLEKSKEQYREYYVRQSQGPSNQKNKASAYAERQINKALIAINNKIRKGINGVNINSGDSVGSGTAVHNPVGDMLQVA